MSLCSRNVIIIHCILTGLTYSKAFDFLIAYNELVKVKESFLLHMIREFWSLTYDHTKNGYSALTGCLASFMLICLSAKQYIAPLKLPQADRGYCTPTNHNNNQSGDIGGCKTSCS